MKKVSVFRHLFVLCVMIASFFMFSKASVQAVETMTIKDNFSFELEEFSEGDPSKGYVISGIMDVCEGDDACSSLTKLDELIIPDYYNSKPIVGIKDGSTSIVDNVRVFSTALSKLSSVEIKKITGGNNLTYIGDYGFASLNVKEVHISSSVLLLGEYVFDSSEVVDVYVNRYYPDTSLSEDLYFTSIVPKSFSGTTNIKHIIFSSPAVREAYFARAVNYNEIESLLTYAIVYKFYDEGIYVDERTYYFNEEIVEYVGLPSRVGFTFKGWFYDEIFDNEQFVLGTKPVVGATNVIVASSWEMEKPVVKMETYVNGLPNENHTVDYIGADTKIDIKVSFTTLVEDYNVSYSWQRALEGVSNTPADFVNDTDTYSLVTSDQNGTYYCKVTIFKVINGVRYESFESDFLLVKVVKRHLKIKIEKKEVTYGTYVDVSEFVVDSSTSLAEGEKIKIFSSKGYTNNNSEVKAGYYEKVLSISIDNICRTVDGECDPLNSNNYVSNYDIEVVEGDLEVFPKHIDVGFLIDEKKIEFGGVENLTAVYTDTVYNGIIKDMILTYTRFEEDNSDADEYKIVGVAINDGNYTVSLDSDDYVYLIEPKKVEVNWDVDDNLIYSGEQKQVGAYYVDVNGNNVVLEYDIYKDDVVSNLVNAGNYELLIDLTDVDDNYLLSNTSKLIDIYRAETVINGERGRVFEYDGLEHSVEVTLNHTEKQPVVQYVGVACKNATTLGNPCKVKVSVEDSENYKGREEVFNIYIDKKPLVVTPSSFEIVYGTKNVASLLRETIIGVNNEVVEVQYSINYVSGGMSVGLYDIKEVSILGSSNSNYDVSLATNSGVEKVEVVKAPIEIVFFCDDFVYDGGVHNVVVRVDGTEEDVGLSGVYEGGKIPRNAGSYKYTVSISNSNYYISGSNSVEFSIAKASYDVSSLKLEDKNVRFNFKGHSIDLEGEVPEGLSYTYELDGVKGSNGTSLPFAHTVKVVFEGDFENYNYVESLEATLYVDMTWVFVVLGSSVVGIIVFVVGFILLVKFHLISFRKKIKRRVFARIIKKNKSLEDVNDIISSARSEIEKEEIVDIVEESVKFVKTEPIRVNKEIVSMSFVDELFKADKETKEYYSEIKNELLSYEGVSSKIKRDYETFYLHNLPIARLDIEDGVLYAFYALDPSVYKVEEYRHENVGKKKEFGAVPLKLKVNSLQSLRHAKMFVRIIRKRENIKSVSNFVRMDYARVYTVKERTFNKLFKKAFTRKDRKPEKNTED